ncbi:MAG: serine/threonine protein kinase, partial [Sorangiineae bacterium PRO1]|nr:serine/threonine protein kinase [Sorangiineae bacterium PRO1]
MGEDQLERLTLTPGTVLAGKYSVERVLGEGGMGVVVAATHLELGERVAVKFLHPDAVENEEVAQRFVREARAAVKIKSEHVARIIDVGRMDNGSPYMVMEYLAGHDLSEEKHAAELGIEDAIDYVIQACDAMAEAHAAGIVHRDLKPANLFLTERADGMGLVKVLDFGISKMTQPDPASLSLTKTATAMGSPLYMSPEQMRSAKTVDHRTDIWSLGVILFELLAKTTPFTGTSLPELCAAILADSPRNLRELRPEVSEELEKVVLKCLERDPARRYQNVAELASALGQFAPRRSRPLIERIGKVLSRAGMAEEPEIPISIAAPRPAEVTTGAAHVTVPFVEGARTNAAWTETHQPDTKKKSPLFAVAAGAAGVA